MNHKKKLISVVMSTFNNENSVEKAISSVLNQTYKNFEFLIMDDCSTDGTFKICTEYSKNDQRIKLFKNKKNLGLTKSLNLLISQSAGELIARQDADDSSMNFRFQDQVELMEKYKLDLIGTRAKLISNQRNIPKISNYFSPKLIYKFKNPFIHGTLMFKKSVFDSIGGYNENFYYSQDYKFITDVINKKYKVKNYRKPTYVLNDLGKRISIVYLDEQKYFSDCVKKDILPNVLSLKNEN